MSCVIAGTMVQMADGSSKAIERVYIGEYVRELNGLPEQVVNSWRGMDQQIYRLVTTTGREIGATAAHPFLTNAGWKRVQDLHPGDPVQTEAGLEIIERIEHMAYTGLLYNLEMENDNRLLCNGFVVGDFVQQNEKM